MVTMAIGCPYCVMPGGKGISLSHGVFDNDEDYYEHIEMDHDIPVRQDNETEEDCMKRFHAKNTRAGGPDCQCPTCMSERNGY
jgi:hypothetical protein